MTQTVTRLADYQPYPFDVIATTLDIALHPQATRVTSRLSIRRKAGSPPAAPLVLDGDGLGLDALLLDGVPLDPARYVRTAATLALHALPEACELTVVTTINPTANTALSGLYRSSGNYCTQCEAEGFRRITWFPDRPDVMSIHTVRIEADRDECPVLLSNGNPVESGILADGRHFAVWHDPWPKPAYLFALVAGDLALSEDAFTTASGRKVRLGIYTEHGKQHLTAYAMDALKRSMRWDEEKYGLEYDLDVFNIVAVSDFNMGAMENKGLNIFNDRYVLADPDTATDADYANIEAIIAHEYFHNWTGNRITCRDWFQLCLKEGLTVFRDHEFSADMRSAPVKRIAEIRLLQAQQFPEDGGPLAHPVRPSEYVEINNFYTATVYEKGSEVVRMLRTILGETRFREGMALYLKRHDGDAATVEQFVAAFAEASGEDLRQFFLWYTQAGTPELEIVTAYDEAARRYSVTLAQSVAPTPGQPEKTPMHIPVAFGLVGPNGGDMAISSMHGGRVGDGVMHLTEARQTFIFENVASRPVLSALRGLSAPVKRSGGVAHADLMYLAAHDADLVSRWQALNALELAHLVSAARAAQNADAAPDGAELAALKARLAADARLDGAYRAWCLAVPDETEIARELADNVDPDAVHAARKAWIARVASQIAGHGLASANLQPEGAFRPTAEQAGQRAIANAVLEMECIAAASPDAAAKAYHGATNMTDVMAALNILNQHFSTTPAAHDALADFRLRHDGNALVLDKWRTLTATAPGQEALARVQAALRDPHHDRTNPNRMRTLVGAFAMANPTGFHRLDGAAQAFFSDEIIAFDVINPQVAARMLTALRSWRAFEPRRREHLRAAIARIMASPGLSRDSGDIAKRMLG
ncbi:MAG: aminopeptidase N [Rhizobiaceae bacterium]|jgi:aminopeptidase N|nr:aminopeptidase N [Rhizobiaceae bacterium]